MFSPTAQYQALSGSVDRPPWTWTGPEDGRLRHEWRRHTAGVAIVLTLLVLVGLSSSPAWTRARLAELTAEPSKSSVVNVTTTGHGNVNTSSGRAPVHAADAVESAITKVHNAVKQQRFSLRDPLIADFPSEVAESMNLSTAPCDNFYEYAWYVLSACSSGSRA